MQSQLYVNDHVILILHYPSLLTKLLILFILQSYCLFNNIIMSDLPINQSIIKVMAVAEKKAISFFESYKPT